MWILISTVKKSDDDDDDSYDGDDREKSKIRRD